jgi:hypothetical protein
MMSSAEQYEYDINGNPIRQPSIIFADRSEVSDLLCISQEALRKNDQREMWRESEKYPRPYQFTDKGKVVYRRVDVQKAIKARGLTKKIDVENSLNLPPQVGLNYLAELMCLSRQQLNKAIDKSRFSGSVITLKGKGKTKVMARKNVINLLFGSSSPASPPKQPEKLNLAQVIDFAKKRREMMIKQAERICEELNGKWNGHRGMCNCPAHSDQSASLSVAINDDGSKVLVYCSRGCSQRDVIDALANMNLWPHRRRRTRRRANSSLPVRRSSNQPYKQRQRRYSEHEYAFCRIRDFEIEAEIELIATERADQAWLEIEEDFYFEKWVGKAWDEQLTFMNSAA